VAPRQGDLPSEENGIRVGVESLVSSQGDLASVREESSSGEASRSSEGSSLATVYPLMETPALMSLYRLVQRGRESNPSPITPSSSNPPPSLIADPSTSGESSAVPS